MFWLIVKRFGVEISAFFNISGGGGKGGDGYYYYYYCYGHHQL